MCVFFVTCLFMCVAVCMCAGVVLWLCVCVHVCECAPLNACVGLCEYACARASVHLVRVSRAFWQHACPRNLDCSGRRPRGVLHVNALPFFPVCMGAVKCTIGGWLGAVCDRAVVVV